METEIDCRVLSLPPGLDGTNSLPTSSRGTTFELRAAHEGIVILWSMHTFSFYISKSDVAFSLQEDLWGDSEDTVETGEIILIQGSGTEQEDIVIHFTSSAEWGRSNRWENFSMLEWLRQLSHKIFFFWEHICQDERICPLENSRFNSFFRLNKTEISENIKENPLRMSLPYNELNLSLLLGFQFPGLEFWLKMFILFRMF